MAACPHSPGNIKTVRELAGMKVDQILIGSCTNSSYADLVKAAQILDGRHISDNVSLGVAPGSRQVLMMIAQDGTLEKFVRAGARILESACGFCIGNHQSPSTNAVSLRTSNRNFEGRSGTKSAQVYLVSPEVAALSAITGTIADPLAQRDIPAPSFIMDRDFIQDDGMIIFPPENPDSVEIVRGPNIGKGPECSPMKETISGEVSIKVGDKITTDHIMPAGARLKYRSNIPAYAAYVFENVDPDFPARSAALRDSGKASFIVAGYSYGQGSSREHAAICPMYLGGTNYGQGSSREHAALVPLYLGVKAVLALSIERIHQANLCNFGILPLIIQSEEDYEELSLADELVIENAVEQVRRAAEGGKVTVHSITRAKDYQLGLEITPLQADMLIRGGRLLQVKEELAK